MKVTFYISVELHQDLCELRYKEGKLEVDSPYLFSSLFSQHTLRADLANNLCNCEFCELDFHIDTTLQQQLPSDDLVISPYRVTW
jgi:hypothetical protein